MQHVRGLSWGLFALLLFSPAAWSQQAFDRIMAEALLKPAEPEPTPVVGFFWVFTGDDFRLVSITFEPSVSIVPEDEEAPPPPTVDTFSSQAMFTGRGSFDRCLFGESIDEAQCIARLGGVLLREVQRAVAEHRLDDLQGAKLRLAGRGDLKRFFDQIGAKRAAFEVARMKYETASQALNELAPLSVVCRSGPFGDGSLFSKTLKKILADRRNSREAVRPE